MAPARAAAFAGAVLCPAAPRLLERDAAPIGQEAPQELVNIGVFPYLWGLG